MIPAKEEMYNALCDRVGSDIQSKFEGTTVGIAGLGGLGSNIAIMLARAGVGRLIIADFDRVDITNLNRQQYKADQIGQPKASALTANLLEIAPYIEIEAYDTKLTEENIPEIYKDADIICEAFDDPEAKAMIVDTVLTKMKEVRLVSGSGMAGFESSNLIKTRKLTDRFYLCGDLKSDVNDGIGLLSTRVTVCAAHEAHMALRIISDMKEA